MKPKFLIYEQGKEAKRIFAGANFAQAKRSAERSAEDSNSVLIVRTFDGRRCSIWIDGRWWDYYENTREQFQ